MNTEQFDENVVVCPESDDNFPCYSTLLGTLASSKGFRIHVFSSENDGY